MGWQLLRLPRAPSCWGKAVPRTSSPERGRAAWPPDVKIRTLCTDRPIHQHKRVCPNEHLQNPSFTSSVPFGKKDQETCPTAPSVSNSATAMMP
ncbi:hypothetical protein LY78DRAFT_290504 [Colletotrichum sublineola]|nr:hypothetical protein LY78DRAFT_290504 [Colletotrichum sublineola]